MRFFKFTLLAYTFVLATNTQAAHKVLTIETAKKDITLKKKSFLLSTLKHTVRMDTLKPFYKKVIESSLKEQQLKKIADSLLNRAELNKKDSFYFFLNKALKTTNNVSIRNRSSLLLSNYYLNNNTYKDSCTYYAKEVLKDSNNGKYRNQALLNLAFISNKKNNYEETVKWSLQGLEMAKKRNDSVKYVFGSYVLSDAYRKKRYYDLAINQLEKAINHITLKAPMAGTIYVKIAQIITLKDPKDPRQIDYFLKAVEVYEKTQPRGNNILLAYMGLTHGYLNLKKNKEAYGILEKFKIKCKELGDPPFYKKIIPYLNARYLQETGQKLKALQEYDAVIAASKPPNYYMISKAYTNIGEILLPTNKQLAKENFLKALNAANKIEEIESIMQVNGFLKDIYEQENDFKNALKYANATKILNDSLQKIENKSKIEEFLIKNDTKEKENKILILEKEKEQIEAIKKKNEQLYGIGFAFFAILLIVGFALFYYIKKQKTTLKEIEFAKEKEILHIKNSILENLSHEIRTPITVINGYLHLIKQQNTQPAEVVRFADLAEKNSASIMSNFNYFLSLLSSKEKKVLSEKIEQKQLTTFFNDILNSFIGIATMKNIGVFYKCNFKDTLIITYDFDKLDKIISNLITNAIKYTNAKKNIYINVFVDAETLKIDVKDEGIGIAIEEQGLIFNRFYQSKKHKTPDGFGIGLSLVKELTDSLNGTIHLKSEENIGSIFSLILPLEKISIELHTVSLAPKYKNITAVVEVDTALESNLPKVLVVDDNLEMISYLKEILQPHYNCIFAHNGSDALERINTNNIDLIISDFKMPVMDGLTLKEELNNLEGENIPFLLVTAYDFEDYAKVKLRLGIEDYIAKPFTYQEIITRTRKLLENSIYIKNVKEIDTSIHLEGHIADLLEKVKGLVLKNISNSAYTTSDLAKDCSYGQQQLGRIIKANTGLTVIQLILEIRLQKAYELIINKKYTTLMEVIYAIGLNNRSYFNKKFTERFGVKPKVLKKKYQN